jgi:hypothetical protein
VQEYARLGDHRTGTPVDDATRAWLASEIERRGGTVEELEYEFDRYAATVRVDAGGRALDVVPLFYSGVGEVDSAEPYIGEIDGAGVGTHADEALGVARAAGFRVAVLATRAPGGRLVGINRAPVDPPGPIGVLVPGGEISALREGPVQVRVDARILPGCSATLVGRFGPTRRAHQPPIVVTTPLTGWFACAGERGTGIAVGLELVHELASKRPVVLVATTGHEIGFLGMHDFLGRAEVEARAVLQLGASVGAAQPGGLAVALVDGLDPVLDAELDAALAPAGFHTLRHDGAWPTEGEGWRVSAPVMSLVASFDRFHTPDDVPAAVTSEAQLEVVTCALLDALRVVH